MRTCLSLSNSIRPVLTCILITASISILTPQTSLASKEVPNTARATLLVLDNCDSNNKHETPPFGGAVFTLNSKGELIKRVSGLGIGRGLGGRRAISASRDGRFFVVCKNVANKLTMYETATGKELWSLSGLFASAVIANNVVYAVNKTSVFAIDSSGTIIKHSKGGGFDIAVDPSGDCLWIVGFDIKKLNLDLQVLLTVDPIGAVAFSVDVNPDGSIWVAEQHIPGARAIKKRRNRLLKVSPQGSILKTIDIHFSPRCVRVDGSDGSVWTTGVRRRRNFPKLDNEWPETLAELNDLIETETHTHKYDSYGLLRFRIAQGGNSIELDLSDSSIWLAGRKKLWHYSSTGEDLGSYDSEFEGQKWLALIPAESTSTNKFYLRACQTGRLIGPFPLKPGYLLPQLHEKTYIVANPTESELHVRECLLQTPLFESYYIMYDCTLPRIVGEINIILKKHLGDKAPPVKIEHMDMVSLITTKLPPEESAYDVLCDLAAKAQLRIFVENGEIVLSSKKYKEISNKSMDSDI